MEASCKQAQDIQNKIIKELEAAPPAQYRLWSAFDIAMLEKYYGKKDVRIIAKLLNKSVSSIYRRASYLGISYKR